jgi:nucleoside triphosphate pyrophosphatase
MALWRASSPLVLASQSAVRRAMLEAAAIPIEVRAADIDERAIELGAGLSDPGRVALLLAREKASNVSAEAADRLVIGADQTLSVGGRRFSKPTDRSTARGQLLALSARTHELHSAVAVVRGYRVEFEHVDVARLTMRQLSDAFLENYLDATGPAVCSSVGGYQLEKVGVHLFERVEGDHFTVLGLPLLPLLAFLRREGSLAA